MEKTRALAVIELVLTNPQIEVTEINVDKYGVTIQIKETEKPKVKEESVF